MIRKILLTAGWPFAWFVAMVVVTVASIVGVTVMSVTTMTEAAMGSLKRIWSPK